MTTQNNYLVLARKYRPNNFDELVGQDYTKQTLINALDSQKLHHGFLFTGTRGVGKTTIARILAKSLNCEQGISSKPCGNCDSCLSITKGNDIDVIEIDAASNTQVDKMRSLLESTHYTPSKSRFKIYIIDEVHMLSTNSFNALLKTLEEPPEHIKFIFATTDPQKIPITILSRCLQFNLQNLTIEEITKQIITILEAENISFELDAIRQIAELGAGSMRDSLSILDQVIAFSNGKINLETINAILGAVSQDEVYNLVATIVNNNFKSAQQIIDNVHKNGANLHSLLVAIGKVIHQLSVAKIVPSDKENITQLAKQIDSKTLQIYYQIITLALRDAKFALSDKINLEMCILRMLALSDDAKKKL
jgi:DNA polymerase-3 subunit gamma/tau